MPATYTLVAINYCQNWGVAPRVNNCQMVATHELLEDGQRTGEQYCVFCSQMCIAERRANAATVAFGGGDGVPVAGAAATPAWRERWTDPADLDRDIEARR